MGTLNFGSSRVAAYGQREVQHAEQIADHLAVVIEHSLLHEQSKSIGRLEERTRLARELHDTLGQSLSAVVMRLELALEGVDAHQGSVGVEIQAARDEARSSLDEAHRLVWDLQPVAFESGGLSDALRDELARARRVGLEVSLDTRGTVPADLESNIEHTVLRIALEALNNVREHAKTASADVVLEYRPHDVRLHVTDDGVGFDPASIAEPGGERMRGFGLASMQERARLVGGRLEIRSAPGAGTEIEAILPVTPTAPRAQAPAVTPDSTVATLDRGATISVLVVDDHQVARGGIRRMLEQAEGIEVVGEAANGETAIRLAKRLRPDVVLLDVRMPGLDGVATLRQMRERGITARVILLSVFARDEQIFDGLHSGARGYLTKDIGHAELAQAIRTVFAGGSLLPPVIAERLVSRLETDRSSELTHRERDVLGRIATGARNDQIATYLVISAGTVKWHLRNIYRTLGASNRTEAVRIARERGLLDA